jgi:hypothetical protein
LICFDPAVEPGFGPLYVPSGRDAATASQRIPVPIDDLILCRTRTTGVLARLHVCLAEEPAGE